MTAAFDGLSLDSIRVAGEMAGVLKANGSLAFYNNDSIFGNGMGGRLQATMLEQVQARAEARFGDRAGVPYWYVDLAYANEAGIPLFSGVGLYGMGGGASRNITRSLPSQAAVMAGTPATGYRIDPSAAFEIRASAVLGTHPSPKPFNADILLTASFTSSGGLNQLGLNGAGYFLTGGVTDRPANPPAKGTVDLSYIVGPPSEFTGNFTFAINRPPATGFGSSTIYFGPDKWFVRAGNAANPEDIKLFLGIGGIGLTTHSYLYLGNDVPPLPPPHPLAPRPTMRAPSGAGGSGFGFGARTEFGFDESYLIFYASLMAGYGFDMVLRDNSRCEGSPTLAGIDGWYATGQAYAYLAGAVGIEVDTWVYSGRLEAFRVGAGATLAGGAPNPVWMQGLVSGRYSVLGGLVRGSVDFNIELGEACRPAEGAGGALGDIELVTDLKPGGGGVSVFEEPSAAFALPLEREFDVVDAAGRTRILRVRSGGIELRRGGPTGPLVAGRSHVEEDGTVLVFSPDSILEGNTRYFARVNAYAEERAGNGAWARLRLRTGGEVPMQSRTTTFMSGARPRTIQRNTVRYTYPVDRQRFFLAEQSPQGRVELTGTNVNYSYMTAPERAGGRVTIVARFTPAAGGTAVEAPATFEAGRIRFNLPTLARETVYGFQLVRREEASITSAGRPDFGARAQVGQLNRSVGAAALNANVQLVRRTLPASRVRPGERLLFSTHFRTSRFGTLQQKMAAAVQGSPTTRVPGTQVADVRVRVPEGFDVFDLRGTPTMRPLIEFQTAIPAAQTRWMRDYATPSVYAVRTRLRNTGLFGDPIMVPTELIVTGADETGVLLAGGQSPRSALTDAELMGGSAATPAANSGGGSSGYLVPISSVAGRPLLAGGGMRLASSIAAPAEPSYTFRYRWNDAVARDWLSTRGYAASAVAIYNSRPRSRPFDAASQDLFRRTATQPFTNPFPGPYPLRFVARFPWGGTPPAGSTGNYQFQLP
jgi:hypothetical protein